MQAQRRTPCSFLLGFTKQGGERPDPGWEQVHSRGVPFRTTVDHERCDVRNESRRQTNVAISTGPEKAPLYVNLIRE